MRSFTTTLSRSENREIRTSACKSDCRLRYGGSWFSAASALPIEGGLTRPSGLARLIAASVRRPRHLAALLVLLLRVRRVYVVLSGSRAGHALDAYFNKRSLGILPNNRLCQGLLLLPEDHADYLCGRSRQALRTNLRRAAAAGIRCEIVSDSCRAFDAACDVVGPYPELSTDTELHARVTRIRTTLARPEVTITVARDQHGRALAVTAAVIDDMMCVVDLAVARCHEARWALHDHLVRILIARRVRYLLVEGGGPFGALGFPTNVQTYQHLLGYELRHVIPVRPHASPLRRRLIALLVALVATAALVVLPAVASTVG